MRSSRSAGSGLAVHALALALASAAAAQDPAGDAVRLRVLAPERAFVGQRIELRLEIDVDREFRRSKMVQLFRQNLDLPVQIEAAWLQRPPAGSKIVLPPADDFAAPAAGARLALADRIVRARRVDADSADRDRFAVEVSLVAGTTGSLRLGDTAVRFAFGTRFREDFVNGRVAEDRTDERATATAPSIEILPLPSPPPAGFTGAVGQFALVARTEAKAVEVGEAFVLQLEISGRGNFGHFGPPDLGGQAGLHALAVEEKATRDGMTATYRLRADRPAAALPALTWVAFDPETASYETLSTAPLGLVVRSGDGSTEPATEPAAPAWIRDWNGTDGDARRIDPLAWGLATVAPWLAAGGLWLWRRRRQAIAADPLGHRARTAFAELQRRLPASAPASGDMRADTLADALAEYLAALLRCPPSAIVGGAVAARLGERGVDPALARRAQSLLDELTQHRYTGGAAADTDSDAARVLDLARELEARSAGGPP